ncbi:MAG: translation initiation factor eIF-1A [Candidatus Aenigmarchaeota archaeon]|nr:translation initiation factor eIF-1A [Candidatus Aenigmarchaeota archaeon]
MERRREVFTEEEEISRIRKPKQGELLAIVEQMLGSDKLRIRCDDGKSRIGRIPGKLRKRVWIRISDLVLVEPWKVMSDERADIVWRYTKTQANWMQKNNLIKNLRID